MKKIKFIHCADLHLDTPFSSIGTSSLGTLNNKNDKSSIRRHDIRVVFDEIIRLAAKEQVDFLFITGDLYEHNYVTKSTINFLNESFKKINKTNVIIIPGNHDPWVKGSYYKSYNWAENVYILTEDKLMNEKTYLNESYPDFKKQNTLLMFKEQNTCIYGQAYLDMYMLYRRFGHYSTESVSNDQINVDLPYMEIKNDKINILLLHGSVGFNFDKNSYNPISDEILASLNMDYIGIGHFHNRIDKVAGLNNVYNPGSPEPLGFDEPGEHGFYSGSITIDEHGKKKLEIEFIPANRKEYLELEVNITGCITDEEIIERIKEKISNINIKKEIYSNLLVNISLTGYISPDFSADIKYVSSYFDDVFFFVKIKDKTIPDYDFDEIKKELGLKGLFVKKILNLIDETEDSVEKELLLKSLYYGMEALEKGQVDISDY